MAFGGEKDRSRRLSWIGRGLVESRLCGGVWGCVGRSYALVVMVGPCGWGGGGEVDGGGGGLLYIVSDRTCWEDEWVFGG